MNANTTGVDQGVEGQDVAIVAGNLDNASGAVRASRKATVTSAGHVDNTQGLISASDTLRLADLDAANPAAKTLRITNTQGTLVADKSLELDAAKFSGDGKTVSRKDLSIALTQDLVNNGEVSASGNLRYATTGTLTNNGKLLAGETLEASGRDVVNAVDAEMRGATTIVNASGTLTNHGLIDGRQTQIDAAAVVNANTGRIYGDFLSIKAASVLNDGDGTKGGTIAARVRLDIGAQTVTNRGHALIFSADELAIGGTLDQNRRATGKAALIDNNSATIESLGRMKLAAQTIRNTNEHLVVERQTQSTALKQTVVLAGQTQELPASDFVITENDRYLALKAHPDKYGLRSTVQPASWTSEPSCPAGDAAGCDAPVTWSEPRNSPRFAQFGVTPPDLSPEPERLSFACSPMGTCEEYDNALSAWTNSYTTALGRLASAIDAYNAVVEEDRRHLQSVMRTWTTSPTKWRMRSRDA